MARKSIPFRIVRKTPADFSEGDIIEFNDGIKSRITKIKRVGFIGNDSIVVIGLCRNINERGEVNE